MTVADAAFTHDEAMRQSPISDGKTKAASRGHPQSLLSQIAVTFVLTCIFWVAMQMLAKHAGHLAATAT